MLLMNGQVIIQVRSDNATCFNYIGHIGLKVWTFFFVSLLRSLLTLDSLVNWIKF